MDRFIVDMPAADDADLMICQAHGVAYQKDRGHIVSYDEAYYNKCAGYAGQDIALKINAGRVALVDKHYGAGLAVDIGIGSGEFIRNRPNTYGRDVNPVAIEWLKRNDLWAQYLGDFEAVTMWDVIEHLETPAAVLDRISEGAYLFISLPIFEDLSRIRESRHYRPGEHLFYFTEAGFVSWMRLHGFHLLERQDFETEAGRDSILSFAFAKGAA
jgi:hypothetical protein